MGAAARAVTFERYLARQVYGAIGFTLAGFLALFAFFDLIHELGDLGKGHYFLREVFTFVLLEVPSHAYELLPVVVLIGTLYVLAQLAGNSEFTVMRAAGLSPLQAGAILTRIAGALVLITFVTGEWIAPAAEEAAQKVRMSAMGSLIGDELQSGLWMKDERSFINVREARQSDLLMDVRIYEFDAHDRLRMVSAAKRAVYDGGGRWTLTDVAQTRFTGDGPRVDRIAKAQWRSEVTPQLIDVLIVDPGHMSIWALYKYMRHLAENRQKTERYEIALWQKVFYPITVLVMVALALPFAYMHTRSGMVGVKVFSGIMLGVFFHTINSVFAHIGLLRNWTPFAAAVAPSAGFFLAALAMMWAVERR